MTDYIKGTITELTPTFVVVENNGIGHIALISLQTYSQLDHRNDAMVYIHHILREDEELDYGFAGKDERELFRLLIGVSGIGAATARMMLSSLTCDEIRNAIVGEDVNKIKSIKGIGLKSAQRLIIELKDKVTKGAGTAGSDAIFTATYNETAEEAENALVMLGFTKTAVGKAVASVLEKEPSATLESIIKQALKIL